MNILVALYVSNLNILLHLSLLLMIAGGLGAMLCALDKRPKPAFRFLLAAAIGGLGYLFLPIPTVEYEPEPTLQQSDYHPMPSCQLGVNGCMKT